MPSLFEAAEANNGKKAERPTARLWGTHQWSLLSVFVVMAVCAIVFALFAHFGRAPKPVGRFFVDPSIVAFVEDAKSVEVFRLAPTNDLLERDDHDTHAAYPVANGPVTLTDTQRAQLCKLLLDQNTWWDDPNSTTSIVPNYYSHRIRFVRDEEVLDIDLGLAHITVFRNDKASDGDAWHQDGRAKPEVTAMINEFIDRSMNSRPSN
jgi:hypothetical protein